MLEKLCVPRLGLGVLLFVLTWACTAGSVMSADPPKAGSPGPAPKVAAPKEKPPPGREAPGEAQPKLDLPDTTQMTLLIQQHMSALGQAIATGNFTVLRDLGAPKFREQNSVAALREKFFPFMEKRIDLTPVILFTPVLVSAPSLVEGRLMRLTGYYSTEPKRVHFDLLFEQAAGSWKLFGISARTSSS